MAGVLGLLRNCLVCVVELQERLGGKFFSIRGEMLSSSEAEERREEIAYMWDN